MIDKLSSNWTKQKIKYQLYANSRAGNVFQKVRSDPLVKKFVFVHTLLCLHFSNLPFLFDANTVHYLNIVTNDLSQKCRSRSDLS